MFGYRIADARRYHIRNGRIHISDEFYVCGLFCCDMSSGWIKLHRQFTKWEWYTDPHMAHFFLHCLLSANHEDGRWRGEVIKRGQFITSLSHLKRDTGISTQSIRTCIAKLSSTQELTCISTNRFRLITLNNYEKYQTKEEPTGHLTFSQQATNKLLTTNKKNKKEKNEEELRVADSTLTPSQESESFFTNISDREKIVGSLIVSGNDEQFVRHEVKKFCNYWTEKSPNGKKRRWQTEKTFEVRRRLHSWLQRSTSFQSS